jgi:hypothetical protein
VLTRNLSVPVLWLLFVATVSADPNATREPQVEPSTPDDRVLDPVQLSAALSRILADPVAKRQLEVELGSNDLQTAVMIVLKALNDGSTSTAPR